MSKFKPSALEFSDVAKKRGQRLLFSGLTFRLAPGELLWIHGENGSGKTTILRLAAGLSSPSAGEITWQSAELSVDSRRVIAYQGHKDAHKDDFTAAEELKFWADIYGYEDDLSALAAKMNLKTFLDVKTSGLSAGQRRRLALSRMIMSAKPIWILDEPTAGLDKEGYSLVDSMMSDHLAEGGSILAASHNLVHNVGGQARRIHIQAAPADKAA